MRINPSLLCLLLCIGISASTGGSATGEPASEHITVAPIDSDGVQRLTMVLDSYSYDPPHVVVQAGRPVELIMSAISLLI